MNPLNIPFTLQLQQLRANAQLTNNELARLAEVPVSTISGLQNNSRRVGEIQARKLGRALMLTGDDLEQFVLHAINTCTEKVLNDAKDYPAQLLNLLAVQLREAGIFPDAICGYAVTRSHFEQDVTLTLNSGSTATLKTQLLCA